MNSTLTEAFDEIPLALPGEEGEAPEARLKDAAALRSIFTRHRSDDDVSAHNRALQQALLDGEPPYDQGELDEANQPDTTNLNFQGAEQRLERAKSPYYKLIHGADTLMSVKTYHGAEDERGDWEAIMAEEISNTITRWDQFAHQTERLIHKHIWEGVGILHWSDDIDWRIRAAGLGQFYFPRRTSASEEDQEIITAYEEYTVSRLWKLIKDEESAKENGWIAEAVRKAIMKASSAEPAWQDWETLMADIKNNDLGVGSRLPNVKIIHGFVEEFDGTVSHYMTAEDSTDTEFLFVSRGRFQKMSEVLILFPYSTGTNTLLHGIRGLGHKVYSFEQQRNRSYGRLIDKGIEASSTMIQAEDEESLANIGLEYYGNLAVIPPNVKVVTQNLPDLSRSVIPAIEAMDRLVNDRTAQYSSDGVFDGDQRKTKAEVLSHLDESASLTDSSRDFFYCPWRKALQQIVRRMTRKNYHKKDPGGEAIEKLLKKLDERGVPREAFYKIDHEEVMETRAIGGGSAASKSVSMARMGELYPRMDDVGKANYDRDIAVDIVGSSNAGRYFPISGVRRTTVDTSVATLENFALLEGKEVPVLDSDKHLAHAREHIKPLVEMFQAVQGGQASMGEAAMKYMLLYTHCEQHIEAVMGDEATEGEANAFRQMLQQIGEVISNGIKEAEAAAEEQAQEQEQEGQPNPEMDAAQTEKFMKAKAEIDVMLQKAEIANEIKLRDAEVDRSIKDANAAAEIQRKRDISKA